MSAPGSSRRVLERAVDLRARLLKPEQMRRVAMFDFAQRGQLDECVPVAGVGVGQARRCSASVANRTKAAGHAGILAHQDRIVRAQECVAVEAACEGIVRRVEPSIPVMHSALV